MGSQVFISPQLGRLAAQAATVTAREVKEKEGAKKPPAIIRRQIS